MDISKLYKGEPFRLAGVGNPCWGSFRPPPKSADAVEPLYTLFRGKMSNNNKGEILVLLISFCSNYSFGSGNHDDKIEISDVDFFKEKSFTFSG